VSSDIQNNKFSKFQLNEGFAKNAQTADLTPMLDAIFLIILLLLATLMNSSVIQGFPVNLPAVSGQAETHRETEPIEISINKEGQIAVGSNTVALDMLPQIIGEKISANPDVNVILRADQSAHYGPVANVLFALSNQLSARQIILVTDSRKDTSK